MAPLLLLFFLLVLNSWGHGYEEQSENFTKDEIRTSKSHIPQFNQSLKYRTFYDFQAQAVAYKDLSDSVCYVERIKLNYANKRKEKVKSTSINILQSEFPLSKNQVWALAGQRIYEFCRGYPTYFLQSFTNEIIDNDIKTNDIYEVFRSKRSSDGYGGRVRGQTQSQYLHYGSTNPAGKAEAESSFGGTRAVVSGTSGMGQAQSQSLPLGCDGCYGSDYDRQQQVLHLGRPGARPLGEIKLPGRPGDTFYRPGERPTGPGAERPGITDGVRRPGEPTGPGAIPGEIGRPGIGSKPGVSEFPGGLVDESGRPIRPGAERPIGVNATAERPFGPDGAYIPGTLRPGEVGRPTGPSEEFYPPGQRPIHPGPLEEIYRPGEGIRPDGVGREPWRPGIETPVGPPGLPDSGRPGGGPDVYRPEISGENGEGRPGYERPGEPGAKFPGIIPGENGDGRPSYERPGEPGAKFPGIISGVNGDGRPGYERPGGPGGKFPGTTGIGTDGSYRPGATGVGTNGLYKPDIGRPDGGILTGPGGTNGIGRPGIGGIYRPGVTPPDGKLPYIGRPGEGGQMIEETFEPTRPDGRRPIDTDHNGHVRRPAGTAGVDTYRPSVSEETRRPYTYPSATGGPGGQFSGTFTGSYYGHPVQRPTDAEVEQFGRQDNNGRGSQFSGKFVGDYKPQDGHNGGEYTGQYGPSRTGGPDVHDSRTPITDINGISRPGVDGSRISPDGAAIHREDGYDSRRPSSTDGVYGPDKYGPSLPTTNGVHKQDVYDRRGPPTNGAHRQEIYDSRAPTTTNGVREDLYDERGRPLYPTTSDGRPAGQFSGRFAGDYVSHVGDTGRFSGQFSGQYGTHTGRITDATSGRLPSTDEYGRPITGEQYPTTSGIPGDRYRIPLIPGTTGDQLRKPGGDTETDQYGRPITGGDGKIDQYGRPIVGADGKTDQYGRPIIGGDSGMSQQGRPIVGGRTDQYGRPVGGDGRTDQYGGPISGDGRTDQYGRPIVSGDGRTDQYGRPVVGGDSRTDQYGRPVVGGDGRIDQYGRPIVGGDGRTDQYGRPIVVGGGGTDQNGKTAVGGDGRTDQYGRPIVVGGGGTDQNGKTAVGGDGRTDQYGRPVLGGGGGTDQYGRPAIGGGGRTDEYGRPIVGGDGRTDQYGRPIVGGDGRTDQYGRPIIGGDGRTDQYGRPIVGGDGRTDQYGRPIVGGDGRTDQYGRPIVGGDGRTDQYGRPIIGGDGRTDQYGRPIGGGESGGGIDQYGRPTVGGEGGVDQYGKPAVGGDGKTDQYGRPIAGGDGRTDQYGRPIVGGDGRTDQYGRPGGDGRTDQYGRPIVNGNGEAYGERYQYGPQVGGGGQGGVDGAGRTEGRYDDRGGTYGPAGYERYDNDSDSQAQSSVQHVNNETQASASAQGRYFGGTAQSQVSGVYTGSGSFSASAGSLDGKRGAQTQVAGGKEGATSSAQGVGGIGQSQAQVQVASATGDTSSSAQSSGHDHGTNTQVQAGGKGGMADAQANGLGSTSSQAQIGFSPYDKTENDQKTPFKGGGIANAQSGTYTGQSQAQLQGKFRYGIKYSGAAQAGSGSNATASRNQTRPEGLSAIFQPFKKVTYTSGTGYNEQSQHASATVDQDGENTEIEGELQEVPDLQEVPTTTELPYIENESYELSKADTDDYYDMDEEGVEETEMTQTPYTRTLIRQASDNQRQHIILDPLEDLDAIVTQDQDPDFPVGAVLQPGEHIPGSPGYKIPQGFRGKLSSTAGDRTSAHGPNSQAQSVTLTPGTGRVTYKKPVYTVLSNTQLRNGGFGYGTSYTYQPVQYHLKSGKSYPRFVSVAKTESGSQNIATGKKTPSVYYTQTSTCGYFTNTCVYNNGKKVCLPRPKTNPDGSPMKC